MNLEIEPQQPLDGPTHPRFRQRLAEVADQSSRSRKRKLVALAVLVAAVLLGYAATQSPMLDIDEVRVIGVSDLDPDELRQVAAIELGQPILGFDTEEVESRLIVVPAVANVAVSTEWNGVATVEIRERQAVARLRTGDGIIVIADDRIVIDVLRPDPVIASGDPVGAESADGQPGIAARSENAISLQQPIDMPPRISDLIEIEGAMFSVDLGQPVPDVLTDAVAVASSLPGDVRQVTDKIELTVDSLELRLVGGGAVSLGDARDLDTKFAAVRAFLAQVDLSCLQRLQVQAPSVPVIERNETC